MSVIEKQINVSESVCEDINLKDKDIITPEDVLKLTKISESFLCNNSNEYQIEFTRFKIRDLETDTTLFDISKDPISSDPSTDNSNEDGQKDLNQESGRFVRYIFSSSFLKLKHVGAT